MRIGDHRPDGGKTLNRGSAGSDLDGVFGAGAAEPTKLAHRRGYLFDGGDHINLGSNSILDFGDGAGNDSPFTLVGVAQLISSGSEYHLFSKRDVVGGKEFRLFVNTNGGLTIQIFTNSTGDRIGRNTAVGAFLLNRLITFACSYDGSKSSSGIQLTINGARADVTDNNSGAYSGMEITGTPTIIGRSKNGAAWTGGWSGDIYHAGVSGQAFSELDAKEYHYWMSRLCGRAREAA
jgi:hypothetical protein